MSIVTTNISIALDFYGLRIVSIALSVDAVPCLWETEINQERPLSPVFLPDCIPLPEQNCIVSTDSVSALWTLILFLLLNKQPFPAFKSNPSCWDWKAMAASKAKEELRSQWAHCAPHPMLIWEGGGNPALEGTKSWVWRELQESLWKGSVWARINFHECVRLGRRRQPI